MIKFYHYKSPFYLEDVNTDKILVCNKIFSHGKICKCFTGYLYGDYKSNPLHTMLPKMIAYVKNYDG